MKDNIAVTGFILMTTVAAVLYYLLGRKEKKLQEVIHDVQKERLEEKLKSAQEEATRDGKIHAEALAHYHQLITRYGDLARKLGLTIPRAILRGNKTDD